MTKALEEALRAQRGNPDTTGLENSFDYFGKTMTEVLNAQQRANRNLEVQRTNYAKGLFFLCILPFLLFNLYKMLFALFAGSLVRVGNLRLFWGMVVRGCVRRDLC